MKFYIVIPAHNEEKYLQQTLTSLIGQSLLPQRILIVNDNSTDGTQQVIDEFAQRHSFISGIKSISKDEHVPGSKIINAFYAGFEHLDEAYDIICKFDADLIFPENYLESIAKQFTNNPECGLAGGFCYVQNNNKWQLENLTAKDHLRGALKAYRKECFEQIGMLKRSMGWDTVDELLARYHGWSICTVETLHVRHLKPTGTNYLGKAGLKQGEAFKKMRYGFLLSLIASAKLAVKKKSLIYFLYCIRGYFKAGPDFIVSAEEGKFIRNLRWSNIKKRFF